MVSILAAGPALAGAWTLPAGDGQAFYTTQRRVAPAGAHFGGLRDDDELLGVLVLEYGVRSDLTAGARLLTKYDLSRPEDLTVQLGGHLRYRLWQGGGHVVSTELGGLVPVEQWFGAIGDRQPDSVAEVQLQVLYGYGWQGDWGDGFVSAGLGGAWRSEGKDPELRFDVTAGQRPMRHFMGLFSVFATVPLGSDSTASLKLAPSIAYTNWPWLGANDKKPERRLYPNTVQMGVAWDALNPEDGLALTISIWKGF